MMQTPAMQAQPAFGGQPGAQMQQPQAFGGQPMQQQQRFPGQGQPQPAQVAGQAPAPTPAPQATPNEQRWQAESACLAKLKAATQSMVKEELQAAVDEAKRLSVSGRELQTAQQLLHEFAETEQREQRQRDAALSKASQEERRKQEALKKQQDAAQKKEQEAQAKREAEEEEQRARQEQADAIIARSRRRAEAMARGEELPESPPKTQAVPDQKQAQGRWAEPSQVRRLSSGSETSASASEAASSVATGSSAIPPLSIDRRQALAPKRAAAALRAAQRRGDDGMDHEIIVTLPGREDTPLGIIMCRYSHQFTQARAQIEDEVDDVPADFIFYHMGRPLSETEEASALIGDCPDRYCSAAGRMMPTLTVQSRGKSPRTKGAYARIVLEPSNEVVGNVDCARNDSLAQLRNHMESQLAIALPGDWVFVVDGRPLTVGSESGQKIDDLLPVIVIQERQIGSVPVTPMQLTPEKQRQPPAAQGPRMERKRLQRGGPGGLGLNISEQSAEVTEVRAGCTAAKAGVKLGWRIREVNGKKVNNKAEVVGAMKTAGVEVELGFEVPAAAAAAAAPEMRQPAALTSAPAQAPAPAPAPRPAPTVTPSAQPQVPQEMQGSGTYAFGHGPIWHQPSFVDAFVDPYVPKNHDLSQRSVSAPASPILSPMHSRKAVSSAWLREPDQNARLRTEGARSALSG